VQRLIFRSVPLHRMKFMAITAESHGNLDQDPDGAGDEFHHVAINVEYHTYTQQVLTFPKRRPWSFNIMLATAKNIVCDLVVQAAQARNEKAWWDWRRSLLFATFGCLYVGMAQWFFYITVFELLLPDSIAFANKPFSMKLMDRVGQEGVLIQVFTDLFVIQPFIYYPAFYILKEFMRGGASQPKQIVLTAIQKYSVNFWRDQIAAYVVWAPADVVVFTAPMYVRMPLDHAVAFLWTMIMSYLHGASPKS